MTASSAGGVVDREATPKGSRLLEWLLASLVFAGIIGVAVFFFRKGYLPEPFFYDTTDTFMDWYNAVRWVYTVGTSTYTVWGSVYPPLSFVFLRFISNPACYTTTGNASRTCDHDGAIFLCAMILVNLAIAYVIFRRNDRRTAMPRALALGLGMPMLFALDRGNLIIPCFTAFMLGHSRVFKAAWARWLCLAVAINFKQYLVVTIAGQVLRRRWRWAEGCAIAIALIYLITLALYGEGTPGQILATLFDYYYSPPNANLGSLGYAPTFNNVLNLLRGPFPIMNFIGSRPIEIMQTMFPAAMRLGELGVFACFAGVAWRPNAVSSIRLAALSMAFLLTMSEPGGYAQIFLFFFVFMEPMKGPSRVVALVATYLLCIPGDYQIVHLTHDIKYSYLSGRTVGYDMGISAGSFVRPALVLLVEYALVLGALTDILGGPIRAWASRPMSASRGRFVAREEGGVPDAEAAGLPSSGA